MKQTILLSSLFVMASGLLAQEPVSSVRIGTNPPGTKYFVDGVEYLTPQTFLWARGSKHTLRIVGVQFSPIQANRFTFTNWTDQNTNVLSNSTEYSFTADPSISSVTANVTLEYALDLIFTDCPNPQTRCEFSNGRVLVGGTEYYGTARIWFAANSEVVLQAEPLPGFVFAGWGQGIGLEQDRRPVARFTLNFARQVSPKFDSAARVQLVTVPERLSVLVDRGPVATPQIVDWEKGVPKLLAAASPQRQPDTGALFVFDRWDNGLPAGQNVFFTPPVGNNNLITLTASFIPGAFAGFYTEPVGLRLKVNGSLVPGPYNFAWGVDREITVEAPREQTDPAGRKYVFDGWSNGVAEPAQTLKVPVGGLNVTARYKVLHRIVVNSNPGGINLMVDGAACRTPCTFDRDAAASLRISAPAVVPQGDHARLEFDNWTDGGGREKSYAFDQDSRLVTVNYAPYYRLAVSANPPEAATFRFDPASPDQFHRAGSEVAVFSEAKPGFRFRRWEGDLQGTFTAATVFLDHPKFATGNFDEVPFADPTGVKHAVPGVPEPGVAAGSRAAIEGKNLTPVTLEGPSSPLAQTLGGLVVRLGQRLLPLYSVSPGRIEFLVPSDLAPGAYRLTIARSGQADIPTEMTVVRNSPGVFITGEDAGNPRGLVLHPSGAPVTPDTPAAVGAEVTILASGCGPYDLASLDGFALPNAPIYRITDPVRVDVGGEAVTPAAATGRAGMTGVNAITFRLPATASSGAPVRLVCNGRASNLFFIPIR